MRHKNNCIKTTLTVIILVLSMFLSAALIAAVSNEQYSISDDSIEVITKLGKFEKYPITIENKQTTPMNVIVSFQGNISPYAKVDTNQISVEPQNKFELTIKLFGEIIGDLNGTVTLSGDINEVIPLKMIIRDITETPVTQFSISVNPLIRRVYINDALQYKVDIQNLNNKGAIELLLTYSIDTMASKETYLVNKTFYEEQENITLNDSVSLIKKFDIPDFLKSGEYIINVKASYLGVSSTSSSRFIVAERFWDFLVFKIFPLKWIFFLLTIGAIGFLVVIIIRKRKESKKRYKGDVDLKTLPKPGKGVAFIGKLAETNIFTYFELNQLTTHTLIAGSTGGGKTVSAEVLVEEALLKGISVIAFDPTAQWTGFLRKCAAKKFLDLYPGFGMKKTEAKAFNGNVHQIVDARQKINLKKYMIPGEIHVFAVNRLDPKDIDILVSNAVQDVFHSNLPESTDLKTLIIFDEVHRLLPKFGGSGEGFLQIERGCREFRKWGVGLMLISQVLTDFIGETKANINTEIQMRTRDEGDLNRIKNKYGAYMLQSLLKAATGVGMIENSAYNKGNPYFVSLRPLLHEHARLSDEELDNYNKYNDIIEELEDQINQLEEYKVDVFDLKLELKMALDKVKSGSFNMVDIYLESLKPNIKKAWDKLGKQPKKRKIEIISEESLKKEFETAKKERSKYEKDEASALKKGPKQPPNSLKLNNGVTVTTLQELVDVLNTLDDATINSHITNQKNDFADWISTANPSLGSQIKDLKKKDEIISIIETGLYG